MTIIDEDILCALLCNPLRAFLPQRNTVHTKEHEVWKNA